MSDDLLKKLKFKNPKLLDMALTHKSYAIENDLKEFNERLEFLGDAVLSAATAVYLYLKYPNYDEGKLSKIKSSVVSGASLYKIAKKLELGKYLKMSKSEEATGGRTRESTLENAIEAVIGAIFLDKGYKEAEKFVHTFLSAQRISISDYKSELQEVVQSKHKTIPVYTIVDETGPDHDKTFTMTVSIRKKQIGIGLGKSKKDAQQSAAKNALQRPEIVNRKS